MCFPREGRQKRSECVKGGGGEKNEKCNHWFLAVGISSTQETVKTAGGSVCMRVSVISCVCAASVCVMCVAVS